jgi:hypothetical protein
MRAGRSIRVHEASLSWTGERRLKLHGPGATDFVMGSLVASAGASTEITRAQMRRENASTHHRRQEQRMQFME